MLFRTITTTDWRETFATNRPRRNKLSEQIRQHLCSGTENQPSLDRRSLAQLVGDTSVPRAIIKKP